MYEKGVTPMDREDISAFADGEIASITLPAALAVLATREGQASWTLYHHIGDALRSVDLASNVSAGFAARMAARMAAEPSLTALAAGSARPAPRPHLAPGRRRAPLTYAQSVARAGSAGAAPVFPMLRAWLGWRDSSASTQALSQLMLSFAAVGAALAAMTAAAWFAAPLSSLRAGMVALDGGVIAAPFSLHSSDGAASQNGAEAFALLPRRDARAPHMPDAEPAVSSAPVQGRRATDRKRLMRKGTYPDGQMTDYLLAHQEFSPSPYPETQYVRGMPVAADGGK